MSVGAERTFNVLQSVAAFMEKAESVFDKAFDHLLKAELTCRQIGIKLKRRTFEVTQSSAWVPSGFSDDRATLWAAFEALLQPVAHEYSQFRLLGCRFTELRAAGDEGPAEAPVTPSKAAGHRQQQPSKRVRPAGQPRIDTLFQLRQRQPPHRAEQLVVAGAGGDSGAVVLLSDVDDDESSDDAVGEIIVHEVPARRTSPDQRRPAAVGIGGPPRPLDSNPPVVDLVSSSSSSGSLSSLGVHEC
jgi:hypothetical protein